MDDKTMNKYKLRKLQLRTADEVFADASKTLALNDNDIIQLLNSKLPTDAQIDLYEFLDYRDMEYYGDELPNGMYKQLSAKLTALRIQQKLFLLEQLQTAGSHWNKWRWLLEARFPEFKPRGSGKKHFTPRPIKAIKV